MEGVGIEWGLLAVQLINLALCVTWVVLAVIALRRMGRSSLSEWQRLGWTALIVLVPILGALAFLMTHRSNSTRTV